jgi:spore maturation protein CgeB
MSRPLRMVFVGDFWRGSTGHGLASGFRKLGWVVQEIDLSRYTALRSEKLIYRIINRSIRGLAADTIDSDIRSTIRDLSPEIFLTIKGAMISAELLSWIKSRGIKTAIFYPDVHFDHPSVSVESFEEFDLFITTKSFHTSFLQNTIDRAKILYVPHGYINDVHWPTRGIVSNDEYAYDVQHIGAHDPSKQVWMTAAKVGTEGASFSLIGPRWPKNIQNTPLENEHCCEVLYDSRYSFALQNSRINVAIMFGARRSSDWQDLVSTRTFEIPACRGFMLHIDSDEVRSFFKPGIEIDVFTTTDELCDKIRFYLLRPAIRASMIEKAFRRTVPTYGYEERAGTITEHLRRLL